MKYSKKILFLVLVLISNYSLAQVFEKLKITPKNILRLFKSTIDQENRNRVFITSNAWSTEKEKYTISDTVIFINPNTRIDKSCCNVINWTFYRENKFVRSYGDYCKEPPTEKTTTKNDYFNLKIKETDNKVFIELYNQEKLIEKFEVLKLEKSRSLSYKNEIQYTITLKRIN